MPALLTRPQFRTALCLHTWHKRCGLAGLPGLTHKRNLFSAAFNFYMKILTSVYKQKKHINILSRWPSAGLWLLLQMGNAFPFVPFCLTLISVYFSLSLLFIFWYFERCKPWFTSAALFFQWVPPAFLFKSLFVIRYQGPVRQNPFLCFCILSCHAEPWRHRQYWWDNNSIIQLDHFQSLSV